MTLIRNTRWPDQPHEPLIKGTERMLLALLSEERHLTFELARVRAEIAPLARAFADDRGEFMVPGNERLRRELGA